MSKKGQQNGAPTNIGTKSQVTKYSNDLIDDHTRSDGCANNRVEALLRVSPQLIVNGEHLNRHQHHAKVKERCALRSVHT
jgi:hypothetical protein